MENKGAIITDSERIKSIEERLDEMILLAEKKKKESIVINVQNLIGTVVIVTTQERLAEDVARELKTVILSAVGNLQGLIQGNSGLNLDKSEQPK